MKALISILCGMFLAGCSAVVLNEPFPESELPDEMRENLEGVWQLEEMAVNIAFTSNGIPWMAMVDWEGDTFRLLTYRLYFTKQNDSLFFCMPTEPGKTNEYFFAEFKQNEGRIVVWNPSVDVFGQLVENGTLAGSQEKEKYSTSITLEDKAVKILELISTNSAAFNYKEPILLRKLK